MTGARAQGSVIVTGGASGIGLAVVETLLGAGWRVVALDLAAGSIATAREHLAAHGERVRFEVAPGPIETPLVRELLTPETRAAWLKTLPLRRTGTPQEVCGAVAFLLDERASSYVTGETIAVDGGFSAGGLINV